MMLHMVVGLLIYIRQMEYMRLKKLVINGIPKEYIPYLCVVISVLILITYLFVDV